VLCVVAGRGLCDEPITRPGEPYRVCVCVIVCDFETSTIRRRRPQLPFLSSVNRAALLQGKEKKREGESEDRTELNYGLACIYIKC
jgi:hypothetical protein